MISKVFGLEYVRLTLYIKQQTDYQLPSLQNYLLVPQFKGRDFHFTVIHTLYALDTYQLIYGLFILQIVFQDIFLLDSQSFAMTLSVEVPH